MLKTIHALRIVIGFIAAWQILGLLPVLSWLGNLDSTTGDMWAIAFIKFVVLLISSAIFLWLGRIKKRLDTTGASNGELRTITIAIATLAVAGIAAAIIVPTLIRDSKPQSKTAATTANDLNSAPPSSTAASSSPQPPLQTDPRDALLQMHADQLNDSQYSAAVDRWLESHPEASSAESRSVMGQLLQEVYTQYPRSALGPALDMALKRGQKYASSPTNTEIPSHCVDHTSVDHPARYSGARVSFNLQNIPLSSFLKLIGEEANRKIIPADDVSTSITACALNIPWDFALDKVLTENGYGQTEYDGSIRVFKR